MAASVTQTTRLFICAFATLIPAGISNASMNVSDESLGFKLTLPDGFQVHPHVQLGANSITHAFVYGDPYDDQVDISILVKRMHGVIGREHVKPERLPKDFQGSVFLTKWQGFDVDAFEVPETFEGMHFTTINVQIPLKHEAIQLQFVGPTDRIQEIKGFVPEVLAKLQGESNWTPSVLGSNITSSEHYGTILLAVMILLIIGGLLVLWLISRRAPRGIVLAMAVAIYAMSWQIPNTRIREVHALSGALRLLGTAGTILGIIDLVRKRKDKPAPEPSQQSKSVD